MFPRRLLLSLSLMTAASGAGADDSPRAERLTHDGREKQRPAWSADGRTLAFARHEDGGSHIWQFLRPAGDEAATRRLTDRKEPEYNAVFLPDGDLLLVLIRLSGTQGNLDIARVGPDGQDPKRLAQDHGGKLSHQDWPSATADGRRFAFSSTHEGNQEIYTAAIDGSDVVRITQNPGHDAHPAYAPDGSRIAFSTDRWGGLELATAAADGSGLTRLTESPGYDDFPAWSPDGRRLAFVSFRDGQAEIYVVPADGSGPAVNVSQHPGRDTFPTWTPDGRALTFLSDRDGGCDQYSLPVDPPAP